jgi:hypothetical protein
MLYRAGIFVALFTCFSFSTFIADKSGFAHAGTNNADNTQQQSPGQIYGKVTDVLEAAGYTYAEVDTGKEKVWAAATTTPLKVGDMVAFPTEMPMQNFHSKAMGRDFPIIYFVSRFITDNSSQAGATTGMASPHGNIKPAASAKTIEGIKKVEGGNTIAEIYADKQKLNGKAIRVRGQVTKYNADVMGKNWLHIRDSSTLEDLTITSNNTTAIDAIVVIEGKLALDKDFGYGYVYPVIVEDASITKE